MVHSTTFTEPFGRIGKTIAENLGAELVGLMMTHQYDYSDGERIERHYVVLVRQRNVTYDSRDHWVVHKVGIHSDGQVGIIGSGGYYLENEAAARKEFLERAGAAPLARVP